MAKLILKICDNQIYVVIAGESLTAIIIYFMRLHSFFEKLTI